MPLSSYFFYDFILNVLNFDKNQQNDAKKKILQTINYIWFFMEKINKYLHDCFRFRKNFVIIKKVS